MGAPCWGVRNLRDDDRAYGKIEDARPGRTHWCAPTARSGTLTPTYQRAPPLAQSPRMRDNRHRQAYPTTRITHHASRTAHAPQRRAAPHQTIAAATPAAR